MVDSNFNPGVGRLVTDRFDFQHHVDGTDFKHTSPSIDLLPAIVVNGVSKSNVQAALEAINALVPQIIPDATISSKGLIQLSGDLKGIATLPRVSGIQGFPITTSTPNNGEILTYDSSIPAWKPAPLTNVFNSLTATGLVSLNGAVGVTGTFTASGPFTLDSASGAFIHASTMTISSTNTATISSVNDITISSSGRNVNINSPSVISLNSDTNIELQAANFIDFDCVGGVAVSIGDFIVNDNVSFGTNAGKQLTVLSTTFLLNNVTIGSALSNSLIIKSNIGSSTQNTTFQGPIAFYNQGRITTKGIELPDMDQSFSVIPYKYLKIPGSATNGHSYTLSDTGSIEGDWFHVYNESNFIQQLVGIVNDILQSGAERTYVKTGPTWTLMSYKASF